MVTLHTTIHRLILVEREKLLSSVDNFRAKFPGDPIHDWQTESNDKQSAM